MIRSTRARRWPGRTRRRGSWSTSTGFEGPIDVLLALARDQKVDLARISIVQLADQYLAFVTAARSASLELVADYLVMAAWLAYLKSRLLLPSAEGDDEPSAEEMAAALAMQLRRLEAMQESGARLMARGALGEDFFARGAPEALAPARRNVIEVSLFELLKAYGDFRRRSQAPGSAHRARRAAHGRTRAHPVSPPSWREHGLGEPMALPARRPRRGHRRQVGDRGHLRRGPRAGARGTSQPSPGRRLRTHLPARRARAGRAGRDRRRARAGGRMSAEDGQHLRLLEALLFASRAPVPVRELTARLPEGADVRRPSGRSWPTPMPFAASTWSSAAGPGAFARHPISPPISRANGSRSASFRARPWKRWRSSPTTSR